MQKINRSYLEKAGRGICIFEVLTSFNWYCFRIPGGPFRNVHAAERIITIFQRKFTLCYFPTNHCELTASWVHIFRRCIKIIKTTGSGKPCGVLTSWWFYWGSADFTGVNLGGICDVFRGIDKFSLKIRKKRHPGKTLGIRVENSPKILTLPAF